MRKMLMLADREEISRGLAESLEYKEIGLRLGRDSSVISREVARHGGRERYRAAAAHEAACAGRERPKIFAVERSPRLRAVVCQATARWLVPGLDRGPVAHRVRGRRVLPGVS